MRVFVYVQFLRCSVCVCCQVLSLCQMRLSPSCRPVRCICAKHLRHEDKKKASTIAIMNGAKEALLLLLLYTVRVHGRSARLCDSMVSYLLA